MEETESFSFIFVLLAIIENPSAWMGALGSIFIFLILLMFSAFVSGSETAFFSLGPTDVQRLKSMDTRVNMRVLDLKNKPHKLLATILIANNFINVGIVIFSSYITIRLFQFQQPAWLTFLIQVVVVTSLILVIGEIMPKIIAHQRAYAFSRFMSGPLQILMSILSPFSLLLTGYTNFINKRLSKKGYGISMTELSEAIEITSDETTPEEEKLILKGIVTFGEKEASAIMKSRVDVVAIDKASDYTKVLETIISSGFSRIPVYSDSFDKIEGILYIKDLLPFLNEKQGFSWQKLIRPAFFVPENKRINELMQDFRERKIHLAIVVDEYGGTSGIVTLEDILEEIVGEISDEFDKETENITYRLLNKNQYVFEAKTSINDFCKIMNLEDGYFDKVRGESDSLGGLMLEMAGKMPDQGSKLSWDRFEFVIKNANDRKINEIEVHLSEAEQETDQPTENKSK